MYAPYMLLYVTTYDDSPLPCMFLGKSVVVEYEVGVSEYISTQRPIDIRYSDEIIFILNISYILTSCITGMDIEKTAIANKKSNREVHSPPLIFIAIGRERKSH